ncbi:VirK/YbjX family protein [Citrobacter freundii]|nr:VirK/YbjX family protein [Citrobacter freundii]
MLVVNVSRFDWRAAASKKRAEYRRRYQLLDSIHSQLSSMFHH